MKAWTVLAVILACYVPVTAQETKKELGIFGRVVNSETHQSIRRAVVKVYTSKNQWDGLTDAEGRFQFPALPRLFAR